MSGELSAVLIDNLDTLITALGLNFERYAYAHDHTAIVMAGPVTGDITVVNVSNPLAPVTIGTVSSNPYTFNVTSILYNYHAVLVASSAGTSITVISILDPTDPTILYSVTNAAFANVVGMSVVQAGSVVAACATDTSLKSVSPTGIISSLQDAGKFTGMIGLERTGLFLVTVATGNDWLTVIDASNPADLQIIGSVTHATLGTATDFQIDGDFVAVTTSAGQVAMFSIQDLTAPVHLYTYTNLAVLGVAPKFIVREGHYYIVNTTTNILTVFDFRSDTQIHFDQQRFDFDGYYDTDSRICLEFYGPATLLALTYQVDDTDNPPANGR